MNGAMAVCRLMSITPKPLCTKKKSLLGKTCAYKDSLKVSHFPKPTTMSLFRQIISHFPTNEDLIVGHDPAFKIITSPGTHQLFHNMPTLHINQFTVTLETPRSLYPCKINWCLNCGESLEVSTNLSDGRPALSQNTPGPLSARLFHFVCAGECSSNLEIVSHCEFPTRSHNIEISCWKRYFSYSCTLKLESENCCMHIKTVRHILANYETKQASVSQSAICDCSRFYF
jgi:hypothetical protein